MTKSKQYQTIVSMRYTAGIYEHCWAGIQVRRDGKRARVIYDYVKWVNNTGHLTTSTVYITAERAHRVIAAFRAARATYQHGNGRGYGPLEVLQGLLESNWSNDPVPSIGLG